MMLSISSFENTSVVQDLKMFFWLAASVTDASVAVNPNGNKMLLDNGVSSLFNNGRPTVINGQRKLRNFPFWGRVLLVALFNKIPLYFKNLITFFNVFYTIVY